MHMMRTRNVTKGKKERTKASFMILSLSENIIEPFSAISFMVMKAQRCYLSYVRSYSTSTLFAQRVFFSRFLYIFSRVRCDCQYIAILIQVDRLDSRIWQYRSSSRLLRWEVPSGVVRIHNTLFQHCLLETTAQPLSLFCRWGSSFD